MASQHDEHPALTGLILMELKTILFLKLCQNFYLIKIYYPGYSAVASFSEYQALAHGGLSQVKTIRSPFSSHLRIVKRAISAIEK
ncbi:hypothetical protein EHN07_19900 [Buttiauxella warmboldiae]|uniref:Uncharacterized protein n=1 Tax=Buttiauxella warmboldiae TaxID=82993 RepID=A0A3N5D0M2_9ENTR|nr:hypothetical protein [Buttiauxella warmboldiae]RPH20433.1 hypothetical protein EHN07_19900 [Buttiauxella warmboldiae]